MNGEIDRQWPKRGTNRLGGEINNPGSWKLAGDAMQTIIECLEHRLIPSNPRFRSRDPALRHKILSCVVIHANEIVVRFRHGRLENINRVSGPSISRSNLYPENLSTTQLSFLSFLSFNRRDWILFIYKGYHEVLWSETSIAPN